LSERHVQRLVATCLNDACHHQGLIDVSNYLADTEVPSFASKTVCANGARDPVRPKPTRSELRILVRC
jgi:hypothetical protein